MQNELPSEILKRALRERDEAETQRRLEFSRLASEFHKKFPALTDLAKTLHEMNEGGYDGCMVSNPESRMVQVRVEISLPSRPYDVPPIAFLWPGGEYYDLQEDKDAVNVVLVQDSEERTSAVKVGGKTFWGDTEILSVKEAEEFAVSIANEIAKTITERR